MSARSPASPSVAAPPERADELRAAGDLATPAAPAWLDDAVETIQLRAAACTTPSPTVARPAMTRSRDAHTPTPVPPPPDDHPRPRRAAVRRGAGRAGAADDRPAAAALAALAVGRRRPTCSAARSTTARDHAEVHRRPPADRDRRRHAGHRPRAAAARRARHGQDAGSPSTSRPRSAATRRCSCRAPPAPARRRSATAGTTPGCWPRARRATALVPSPVMRGDGRRARSPASRS